MFAFMNMTLIESVIMFSFKDNLFNCCEII